MIQEHANSSALDYWPSRPVSSFDHTGIVDGIDR